MITNFALNANNENSKKILLFLQDIWEKGYIKNLTIDWGTIEVPEFDKYGVQFMMGSNIKIPSGIVNITIETQKPIKKHLAKKRKAKRKFKYK